MSSALILLLIHCTAGMRDIPALVSALHQYMRHTFLSVYYIQQPDLKQFLTLQKILKFARVSVAVSSLQQYYNSSNTFHVILPPYDLANNISSLFGEYCNMSMSWLIFIDVPTHQLMKNSHIPVNCEVIVVHADSTLTEVYHLQNNLQESAVGSWSDTHGLQWTAEKFLQRRSNLKGITLKAATISNPPILVPVEQNGIVTSVEGFFGDVWAILEKKMNFTSVYSVPHDGAYCAIYKNGSWSGMIGMIRNHEVEVAISDFTITNIRAEVIDFTQPLIFTRFCVLIKQPDSAVTSWTSFLAPFSTELWLTILAAIFLIAFHLTVYYQHFTSPSKFLDAVFQAFAMFCLQVSGQETPRSLSGRILYLAAYLTVMILPAAYSAALISFLTVQINELPFTTLKGLVEHSSYQLEVLANSAPLNYFDKSTDPLMMQINKEHIQPRQDELPLTVHQGLLRACTRRNYAFMTSLDIAMAMTKDIPCSVIPILGAAIPDTLALALSKRSPYRELINYNLQDIQRSGVMARLRINAWPGKTTQLKPLWTDVTIDTVMPVLGIVAAGIVIAFVFLSFEYLICKLTALFLAKNMGVIS